VNSEAPPRFLRLGWTRGRWRLHRVCGPGRRRNSRRRTRPAGAIACRIACAVLRPVARLAGGVSGSRVVASVATREHHVALTVDDGPDPATTPELLRVLRSHDARATFFLIGERAQRHPDLVQRIVVDGHEVANHLMREEPSVLLPATEFQRQLAQVHDLLTSFGDVAFFRPGSGWFSVRMLRDAARQGYGCAMGSPLLLATEYKNPRLTGRRLAGRAHPGAIIVLHEGAAEGADSRVAVSAVAHSLLARLTERNLYAISLSELTAMGRNPPHSRR
jgi:peptidoglycan-N-acetylglucosamine deacetylase